MKWLSGHARINYISLFRILQRLAAALDRGLFALLFAATSTLHGRQALVAADHAQATVAMPRHESRLPGRTLIEPSRKAPYDQFGQPARGATGAAG